jgi:hypothetical protein
MMQQWADYLTAVEKGADVIPFRRGGRERAWHPGFGRWAQIALIKHLV